MQPINHRVPNPNHGLWLKSLGDCDLIPLAEDNEYLAEGGTKRFSEALLEEFSGLAGVSRGAFLGIEGGCIIVPEGALEDAYSNAFFEVFPTLVFGSDVYGEEGYVAMTVYVSAIPSGIERPSLRAACDGPVPASVARLLDGRLGVQAVMLVDGDHIASVADDVLRACLVLDALVVEATVIERLAGMGSAVEPWDPSGVLEGFGLGGRLAKRQAEEFRRSYSKPEWQLRAPFSLPYNLEVVRKAGVLDAVAREAGTMPFGFDRFIGKRWFFGGRIIQALLRRGFSPDQVAHVVCHDQELMARPVDRVEASELCEMIICTAFDPASLDDWNAYTAMESGSLLGFL